MSKCNKWLMVAAFFVVGMLWGGAEQAAVIGLKAQPGRFFPDTKTFVLEGQNDYAWQNEFAVDWPGSIPVAGDWDGDGKDSVGLYDPVTSTFRLRNSNTPGLPDYVAQFGPAGAGWLPVVGDWDGNHTVTIGLYDPKNSRFYLRNWNNSGPAQVPDANGYQFGPGGQGWLPITGDWTNKGYATAGLYAPNGTFYLKNIHGGGNADITTAFGTPNIGQVPVSGDWDGDGKWQVGLYHPFAAGLNSYFPFLLRNPDGSAMTRNTAIRGTGAVPLAGRWAPSPNEPPQGNTTPPSPPWTADLKLVQVRIDTVNVAAGRTFEDAVSKLDWFKARGATGIVLTPVNEMNHVNGQPPQMEVYYDVTRPDLVDNKLSKIGNGEASFKAFAAACHQRGLKLIVDVVNHGINPKSVLITQHPTWFCKDIKGNYVSTGFGDTIAWDWHLPEVRAWWKGVLLGYWRDNLGVDGFRCDLERSVSGFAFWNGIVSANSIVISEEMIPKKNYAYTVSQEDCGIGIPDGPDLVNGPVTLEQFLASSQETFLSSALSCHDRQDYGVQGKPAYAAYGCLVSNMLPRWYMGEESGLPKNTPTQTGHGSSLYFTQPDWTKVNQAFVQRWDAAMALRSQWSVNGRRDSEQCRMIQTLNSDLTAYVLNNGKRSVIVAGRKTGAGEIEMRFGDPMGTLKVNVSATDYWGGGIGR